MLFQRVGHDCTTMLRSTKRAMMRASDADTLELAIASRSPALRITAPTLPAERMRSKHHRTRPPTHTPPAAKICMSFLLVNVRYSSRRVKARTHASTHTNKQANSLAHMQPHGNVDGVIALSSSSSPMLVLRTPRGRITSRSYSPPRKQM
jgi:hypothetical protein